MSVLRLLQSIWIKNLREVYIFSTGVKVYIFCLCILCVTMLTSFPVSKVLLPIVSDRSSFYTVYVCFTVFLCIRFRSLLNIIITSYPCMSPHCAQSSSRIVLPPSCTAPDAQSASCVQAVRPQYCQRRPRWLALPESP